MFSHTCFDDCSFLFLYTYFNGSISEIYTSPEGTGELSPSKIGYDTL